MGRKGGEGSFLGFFRRRQKDEPPEPDRDSQDKPETEASDAEDIPTSEKEIEDFLGAPRPWEHAGDEESAIQTYIEKDTTSREPTAIVDIPLGSSEEGETTLRAALQEASSPAEDTPAGSAEPQIGKLLDPNSTVHIELPESLMAVEGEADVELSDTGDEEATPEEEVRLTDTEEESPTDRDSEAAEPEEQEEAQEPPEIEEVPPEAESIEVPVYRSDYKPSGVRDVPLDGKDANEDRLGILAHTEALARYIEDSDTPFCLGIQGEAGSGKTSFMRYMMQALLATEREGTGSAWRVAKVQTAWFNACPVIPLDSAGDLCFALVACIADAVKKGFATVIDKDSKKSRALERAMKVLGDTEKLLRTFSQGRTTQSGESESQLISGKAADKESEPNLTTESIIGIKERLVEIMGQYREATETDRLVVFIDDVDLVPPEQALAFLKSIYGLLNIEGLVFIIACNANTLIRSLESKHGVWEDSAPAHSFLDRVFQASYSLPSGTYNLEDYLEDLLRRGGLNYDRKDLKLFLDLINLSVGANPQRIKRLVNKLTLLRGMQKDRESAEDSEAEADVFTQLTTTLFGAACLEAAFGSIYHLMLAEIAYSDASEDNFSGLVSLLERPRGSHEEFAAAFGNTIQSHPMLAKIPTEPSDPEDTENAAIFISLLRSMLAFDVNGRLELKQVRELESALLMASRVASNTTGPIIQDPLKDMATDFSRLVEEAVNRLATNPPQAHNKWAHHEVHRQGYSYRLWFRPQMTKIAWGGNRLFYCLNFDIQDEQTVKLGLQFSVGNMIREGVTKETLEALRNEPIFQEGNYVTVEDLPGDWTGMEMRFDDSNWSTWTDSRVKQAYAVAGELNRLIEATSHLFDVKAAAGVGTAETRGTMTRVNAPCPKCGKKDLAVLSRMEDGSLRLQCMHCKSKVQAKPSPTTARPTQTH